jgi:hypothetical protein
MKRILSSVFVLAALCGGAYLCGARSGGGSAQRIVGGAGWPPAARAGAGLSPLRGLSLSPATPTPEPTPRPVCDCSGNLYNCADFASAQEAQDCYATCQTEVGSDVHLLDGDENGVVCETVWGSWATPAAEGPADDGAGLVGVGGSGLPEGCSLSACSTFDSCGAAYAELLECLQVWDDGAEGEVGAP